MLPKRKPPHPILGSTRHVSTMPVSTVCKQKEDAEKPHLTAPAPRLPIPSVGSAICGSFQDCRLLGEFQFTPAFVNQSISDTIKSHGFYRDTHHHHSSPIEDWLPPPQEAPPNNYGKQSIVSILIIPLIKWFI
jgi:hypothetical protein